MTTLFSCIDFCQLFGNRHAFHANTAFGGDADHVNAGRELAKVHLVLITADVGVEDSLAEGVHHSDVVHAVGFDVHDTSGRVRIDAGFGVLGHVGDVDFDVILAEVRSQSEV